MHKSYNLHWLSKQASIYTCSSIYLDHFLPYPNYLGGTSHCFFQISVQMMIPYQRVLPYKSPLYIVSSFSFDLNFYITHHCLLDSVMYPRVGVYKSSHVCTYACGEQRKDNLSYAAHLLCFCFVLEGI